MLGLVTMQTREEMALARIVSGKGVFLVRQNSDGGNFLQNRVHTLKSPCMLN